MNCDNHPPDVYLRPSQVYIHRPAKRPVKVTTILGSCVSLTLFSPATGMAAMCHALMPECHVKTCPVDCAEQFKYAGCAVSRMMSEFTRRGIPPRGIQAKLFGGADMFDERVILPGMEEDRPGRGMSIGRQNVMAMMEAAARYKLRLSTTDVGGTRGRKIMFHTGTGDVWMKRLGSESARMRCP
jgi:chemotaxis protein CheD